MRRALICLGVLAVAAPAAYAKKGEGRCGPITCRSDVSVSGHSEPQPIKLGGLSDLKVSPKNNGPDGVFDIDLQIAVAPGLEVVEVKLYGGRKCSFLNPRYIKCEMGDFRREQMGVVRVRVRGIKQGTHISRAKVYSTGSAEPNGGNNQVSMTTGVKDPVTGRQ